MRGLRKILSIAAGGEHIPHIPFVMAWPALKRSGNQARLVETGRQISAQEMKRIDPRNRPTSTIGWIAVSILVAMLFLAGLMSIMNSGRDDKSAAGSGGSDRSSATTGEGTAGSGTTTTR